MISHGLDAFAGPPMNVNLLSGPGFVGGDAFGDNTMPMMMMPY